MNISLQILYTSGKIDIQLERIENIENLYENQHLKKKSYFCHQFEQFHGQIRKINADKEGRELFLRD